MSTKSSISALSGLALLALFAARPALAADVVPGDSTTYATAGTRIAAPSNVTPGPIASHLVYLGESRERAIEQARQAGEQPRVALAESAPAARSSYETYQRVMGLSSVGTQPSRKGRAFNATSARS